MTQKESATSTGEYRSRLALALERFRLLLSYSWPRRGEAHLTNNQLLNSSAARALNEAILAEAPKEVFEDVELITLVLNSLATLPKDGRFEEAVVSRALAERAFAGSYIEGYFSHGLATNPKAVGLYLALVIPAILSEEMLERTATILTCVFERIGVPIDSAFLSRAVLHYANGGRSEIDWVSRGYRLLDSGGLAPGLSTHSTVLSALQTSIRVNSF